MDTSKHYCLSPEVKIRSECFGGLIFSHDTSKLHVLYSLELVELLLIIDSTRPLKSFLDDVSKQYRLQAVAMDSVKDAFIQLISMGIINEAV